MVSRFTCQIIALVGGIVIFEASPMASAQAQSGPLPSQLETASSSFRPSPPPNPGGRPITPEGRGDIQMARKMYREAVDSYKSSPETAVLDNKIGIAYHQMLETLIAKTYYEKAVKLNPKYSEAINNLGTVYYTKKQYRRSVGLYRRALRLNPQSASIMSNLGTAYFARKNYKEAFEIYQKALAIDPEVFEHRSTAGILLQERPVEERARYHFYLAKTYAGAGMNDRALMYIRKAIEEGFKERDKFGKDPDFASLRELTEFKELMAAQPRVL